MGVIKSKNFRLCKTTPFHPRGSRKQSPFIKEKRLEKAAGEYKETICSPAR